MKGTGRSRWHKMRLVVLAAFMPLAGLLLVASPAHANTPGDGCYYDIRPVGHLTYINAQRQLFPGGPSSTVTTETIGWIQQEYSSSCRHTVGHIHLYSAPTLNWYGPWSVGIEILHNTPSGVEVFSSGYVAENNTTDQDIYSSPVNISDDWYDSFSVHATFQGGSGGSVTCNAFTDTHDFNTGGNTAGGNVHTACNGVTNQ